MKSTHLSKQQRQPQQQTTSSCVLLMVVLPFAIIASAFNIWGSFSQVGQSSFDGRVLADQQEQPIYSTNSHNDEIKRLVKAMDQAKATVAQIAEENDRNRQENQQLRKRVDKMEKSIHNHDVDESTKKSLITVAKQSGDASVNKEKSIAMEEKAVNTVVEELAATKSPFKASSPETTNTKVVDKNVHSTANQQQAETDSSTSTGREVENSIALGPVQAIPDLGERRNTRLPPTDRQLHTKISDIPHIPFDSHTINPILPSEKVDAATMWNVEIPPNYSITAPMTSTVPWSNVTTMALLSGKFCSGYRNQMMAFTMLVMETVRQGHGQLLLASVSQKDLFGTNKQIPFARLWDVEHWNSFYPRLPRLVDYDPVLHSQFNFNATKWYHTPDERFGTYGLFASNQPMRPHGWGKQSSLQAGYTRYAKKGRGPYINPTSITNSSVGFRNPIEILMMQGAMRPHPNLQAIMDRLLSQSILVSDDKEAKESMTRIAKENDNHGIDKKSSNSILEYMTLHARVEPDMQKHPVCRDRKVLNLTDIFDFIQAKWPEPPVTKIFMPINRKRLEGEGLIDESTVNENDPNINWIAVENLKALNQARDEGLWNGRVKVLEFGINALENTEYADRPSVTGSMVDFFIGINANIFIGTEVSSFSHDLLATRFFRNHKENYKYLPDGLHEWTPLGTIDPPGFGC